MWIGLIGFVVDRTAKGWPLLSEIIKRRKGEIQALAGEVGDTTAAPDAIASAAPGEVKELVIKFLERMRERAPSLTLKATDSLLINLAPILSDAVWDQVVGLLAGQDATTMTAAASQSKPLSAEDKQAAKAFADALEGLDGL